MLQFPCSLKPLGGAQHQRRQRHKSRIWLVQCGKISVLHVRTHLRRITCLSITCWKHLNTWKDHRYYGFIINRASVRVVSTKSTEMYTKVKWFGISLVFYVTNTLHDCLETFLFLRWKIFHSFVEVTRKIRAEYIKFMNLNYGLKQIVQCEWFSQLGALLKL